MIITDIEELRLYFPAHAIDHIGPYAGFIDNSEHDFLLEPLGEQLYERMCEYYDTHKHELSTVDDQNATYFNRLILMAQRCVAFDFMGAAIDVQAISINNAGLNYSSTDDYKTADRDARRDATAACSKEAHKSLNRLLYTLEAWVKRDTVGTDPSVSSDSEADEELREIVTLWQSSRYYYLAAQMLLPSAKTMQEYINIYDSREKFIQLLPDLRYVQEEQLAPAIGEEFLEYLVDYALRRDISPAASSSRIFDGIVHKLRKIACTFLEARTQVLKIDKDRKIRARDEAVLLLGRLCERIRTSQEAILIALGDDADLFRLSPLYEEHTGTGTSEHTGTGTSVSANGNTGCLSPACSCGSDSDSLNSDDLALHVTMPLL